MLDNIDCLVGQKVTMAIDIDLRGCIESSVHCVEHRLTLFRYQSIWQSNQVAQQ